MRILINALTMKIGGGREVLVGTLRALARFAPEHEYVVYASARLDPPMPPLPASFDVRHLPRLERRGWSVFLWEQIALARIARREKIDAMYSMCNHGPRFPGCRQVLFIQNAALFVSRAEPIPGIPQREAAFRRALARLAVAGSDIVLVQTRAMAGRVRRFIPGAARKLVVSPQGVPEFDAAPELARARRGLARRLDEFRDRHEFVVCAVGYYVPYKNLETLVEAVRLALREVPGLGLVVTLDAGWCDGARRLVDRTRSPGLEGHVLATGSVPHSLLPEVYTRSDLLCFPSLLESYGLPMVEAMSFGLPVLAADTPVNREICGGAALYHAQTDPRDLAGKIARLARSLDVRVALRGKALDRARAFDWGRHLDTIVATLVPETCRTGRTASDAALAP